MTKPFPGKKVPLAPFYDLICDLTFLDSLFKHRVLESLNLQGTERIADIGCGSGRLLRLIKQNYPKTILIGVDPDLEMLAVAQKNAAQNNLDIEFRKGEGGDIPLPNRSVDVAISTLAIHHMDDKNKHETIQEMCRILKAGGTLLIADIDKPRGIFQKINLALHSVVESREFMHLNVTGKLPAMIKKTFPSLQKVVKFHFVTIWKAKK